MSSYEESLRALDTRENELEAQSLELHRARERLAVERQQLEAQKLVDSGGLTKDELTGFRKAVKCVVRTITAEDVTHASLEIVDEPSTDPEDKPYSIDMTCCYSTYDIAGMTYNVTIKTQNPAIVAVLRSMIRQVGPSTYDESYDESKCIIWHVYWDDYATIKLND